MDLWIKFVTFSYLIFNGIRVFSCIPQILSIAKEASPAKSISLSTWGMLTMGMITTALYSIVVRVDLLSSVLTTGSAIGCLGIVSVVIYKRKKYDGKIIKSKTKSEVWATDEDFVKLLEK